MINRHLFACLAVLALTGCEQLTSQLGIESPGIKAARQNAEGKAVGSACRHSGRAIEDCYSIYAWLPKASVYAGWREMDEYMRENKIDTVAPMLPPAEPPGKKKKKPAPAAETNEAPAGEEAKPAGAATDTTTHKAAQ